MTVSTIKSDDFRANDFRESIFHQSQGGRIVKVDGGAGSYAPSSRLFGGLFAGASASALALSTMFAGTMMVVPTDTAMATVVCRTIDQPGGTGDNVASGSVAQDENSVACGIDAQALAESSLAMGFDVVASGVESTAIGNRARAEGSRTVAVGVQARALNVSTAIGSSANALGANTTAIGPSARVDAVASRGISVGVLAVTTAERGVAIGQSSGADIVDGAALGSTARVSGTAGNVALGAASTNTASVSGTAYSVGGATVQTQVSVGGGAYTVRRITNVAPGADAGDAVNVAQLSNQAEQIDALIGSNDLIGPNGIRTDGIVATVGGTAYRTVQEAIEAAAMTGGSGGGDFVTSNFGGAPPADASGNGSSAGGDGAVASGTRSLALGAFAEASAQSSAAIGLRSEASGEFSIAAGFDSTASGENAVAIGRDAAATAVGDVALGQGSTTVAAGGLAYGTQAAAPGSVMAIGNRRIQGVSGGVNATDAVNVAQLSDQVDQIDALLGAANLIDANGDATDATIATVGTVAQITVGGALNAQDTIVTNQGNTTASVLGGTSAYNASTGDVTGGFTYDSTPQSTVQAVFDEINTDITNINNGTAGLVQQAAAGAPITVAAATDGMEVQFDGTAGTRTLSGLSDGAVTGTSDEAINGSQLAGVTNNIDALVGSGNVLAGTLPSFTTPNGGTADNVTEAFQRVTAQVNTNTTNINNSGAGLVQQAAAGAPITVAAATDGTEVQFDGTAGTRVLSGLSNGAVTGTSDEAVNGSQLFDVASNTNSYIGGGADVIAGTAPTFTVGTATHDSVGAAIAAQDAITTAQGNATASVLGGTSAYNASTGDVTGGFTYDSTAQATVQAVFDEINTDITNINNSGAGLVQQAAAGAPITVAAATDGTEVQFDGTAGTRVLSGLSNGAVTSASDEAVNGSQLFGVASNTNSYIGGGTDVIAGTAPTFTVGTATHDSVGAAIAAQDAITTAQGNATASVLGGTSAYNASTGDVTGGFTYDSTAQATVQAVFDEINTDITNINNSGAGLVQQAAAGAPITVAAATDGMEVQFDGTAGTRTLSGLSDGAVTAASDEAVNGSQLFDVASNTNSYIGGGADVIAGTAPTFTVGTATHDSVGAAIAAQDAITTAQGNATASVLGGTSAYNASTGDVTGGFTYDSTPQTTVQAVFDEISTDVTNINNGTAGLVQQAAAGAPITVAAATDGMEVQFDGTAGTRTLSGLSDGAVTAASDEAVNGSQLFANNTTVSSYLGGGTDITTNTAPTYNIDGTDYNDVGSALDALETVASAAGGDFETSSATATVAPMATGDSASAGGDGAIASANQSLAVGAGTRATGFAGVALGSGAEASQSRSFAGGLNSEASGNDSIAIGTNSSSTADGSVAFGRDSSANGNSSIAFGEGASASGNSSALGSAATASVTGTAVGRNTTANGVGALASGIDAMASANGSTSLGSTSQATANNAVALGTGAIADVAGSIAIGSNSNTSVAVGAAYGTGAGLPSSVMAVGNRRIQGVADGADLSDAVTVRQLASQADNINMLVGEDVFDAAGNYTAPSFMTPNNNTADNIDDAFEVVTEQVDFNTTNINNINNGTAGLVQQAAAGAPITVAAATDGMEVQFDGTAGTRVLSGLSNGAVTGTSDEAVNGSQLFDVASNTNSYIGGGADVIAGTAPTFTVGTATHDSVGAAIAAQDAITTAQGNATASVLGGASRYNESTGVVTGGFTYDTTPQSTVQAVFDEINTDITNINNGTAGLVQQAAAGAPITVAAATDGMEVQFDGTAGTRVLSGLSDGAVTGTSDEAINGSQLAGVTNNIDALVGSGNVLAGTLPSFTTPNGGMADNVTEAFQRVTTQVNGNTTNINNINNGTTGAFRSENAAMDAAPSNAGPDAVAGGFGSQANASQATAIGNDALANGSNASAIGYGAQANAANAAAIGSDARANAANATALGFRASATNVGDVALGFGTRTSASTDAGYATATGAPANGIVGIGDRRIQGVAAGAEADEAVNVAQLNAVAQAGATAFGGGAAVDPMTGAFTAPTYTVGAANYDNVGAAITAQDDITTAQGNTTASTFGGTSDYDPTTGVVTGGFTYDATAQTTVQSVFDEIDADITNITNGDVGLVRQAGVPGAGNVAPITVGATTNGTEVLFNNLAGANRRLIGVANGAVTASSNEAVNGSQLFGVTTNIDALVGSGDVLAGTLPSFTTPNGGTADNVTDAFQEVTEQVDTNTTNIANNTTNITNLDNRVTTNETNIANNRTDIDQNRTDIDNLDNRVTVNETNIANNRTDIDTNTTNIANNRTDIDTNTTNIADNRTDIDQNTTNIADNRTDIDSNTTEINNITNGGGIKYFRADNTDQADAIASGENAIAAGQNAQALGTDSAAFGHNASAQGDNTTAVGAGATAFASTALGAGSAAAGGGTAVGDNARAGVDANNMPDGTNNNNAFGNDSVATGGNATALGYNSQATGENSTAVGNGAQATYANSTAVGAGAQTRMVDQVVLGTATSTVTAQGVLQNGDVTSDRIVSINAEGDMRSVTVADITEQVAGNITVVGGSDTNVNGPNVINIRDGSITSVDIADGAINTRNIADGAVTYNKLGADVRNRFNELNDRDNRNTAGVALATAIANIPQLSQEGKFSIGGAFGAFNGEGGWAFGANGRFSENVVGRTSVGITSQGDVAVGAGIAMEF